MRCLLLVASITILLTACNGGIESSASAPQTQDAGAARSETVAPVTSVVGAFHVDGVDTGRELNLTIKSDGTWSVETLILPSDADNGGSSCLHGAWKTFADGIALAGSPGEDAFFWAYGERVIGVVAYIRDGILHADAQSSDPWAAAPPAYDFATGYRCLSEPCQPLLRCR